MIDILGVWIPTWDAARWESGACRRDCVPYARGILRLGISGHQYSHCAHYCHCLRWDILSV